VIVHHALGTYRGFGGKNCTHSGPQRLEKVSGLLRVFCPFDTHITADCFGPIIPDSVTGKSVCLYQELRRGLILTSYVTSTY
jgi:hypothetical protein